MVYDMKPLSGACSSDDGIISAYAAISSAETCNYNYYNDDDEDIDGDDKVNDDEGIDDNARY